MGSLSLSPRRLRLLPLLTLLLPPLLLLPPPARGAVPPRQGHERSAQLEAIRSVILGRLGLSAPPDVRPQPLNISELQKLQRRYDEALVQLRSKWDQPAPDSDRSSGPKTYKIRMVMSQQLVLDPSDGFFYLKLAREALVPGTPETTQVERATLFISRGRVRGSRGKPLRVDVTRPLRAWLQPGGAPALRERMPPRVSAELLRGPQRRRAYLEVKVRQPPVRERRRAREPGPAGDCEEAGADRCCPRPQSVAFDEIGWGDWVLAPRQFEMRFCEGSCPHNYRPASMHSQLKARLHRVAPALVGPPCCVPSSYEPIVLMHYGSDGQVALTTFEDLVPTACHCA
ncbi:growth/differentiation factor 15 [Macrotis lagotis]|uniref:growth/differentiation factor 15 n=1 Tax=Macrotis lagotis TaxID=92651 RepID=UPI003D68F7CD